ncbi:MAG: ABC transporter permease [Rhodoblastus sp.]|nr:ABC transporter permease [Rhodoblastus sp.]
MAQGSALAMIGRRLLQAAPVIVLATFIVFGLLKLLPGDVAVTLAGDNATDERIAEIRRIYGLDRPFLVQYGVWLWKAAHGDLSQSILSGEQVVTSIARCFPHTLLIVAMALGLALIVGVPLGAAAAVRPNGLVDRAAMMLASIGIAVPNFWLAMILVSLFALRWNIFPATGATAFSVSPTDAINHAILPALALAAGGMAEVARQVRGSLLDVMSSQFVRTLRAKGLKTSTILWRHGLKNIAVNLLTVTGLLFNRLLAATVVVEAVFAIPGMGGLIVHAAIQRDFTVVQGVVFAMVIVVILVNLVTDMLCAAVDPRIGR